MSRVLVTGGVGAVGMAVVRRLLADAAYEARVADWRAAPRWMREGCEVHTVDLRVPEQARAAVKGCGHVIHLAEIGGGMIDVAGEGGAEGDALPHTVIETNNALDGAVMRAALEAGVERFVYGSSVQVFEGAELFPTPEDHLAACRWPRLPYGFSKLAGEVACEAARVEHGLRYTICRASSVYGPDRVPEAIAQTLSGERRLRLVGSGQRTMTPTCVEDMADGILAAMASQAALNEDFNLSASRELTIADWTALAWETCGEDAAALALEETAARGGSIERCWPLAEKAERLLGWRAGIGPEAGMAATVGSVRQRTPIGSGA
jgi:UDP-glucose 4-epimerase